MLMDTTPIVQLSKDQIDFFHREGYLVLDQLVSPSEVDRMREIYDRLFDRKAGRELGEFYDLGGTDDEGKPFVLPQMMNPSRYAPEIATGQFRLNAAAIARQLLGADCEFRQDLAICKPPGSQAPTAWHQDAAYLNPKYDHENINIWIPLQTVTPQNGCLHFIPGSHKSLEILPHHPINNDPRIEGLECDRIDQSKAVAVPIPAGGATIHHCRVLHYAGPNLSTERRRAYILEFQKPPTKRSEPLDFYWQRIRHTNRQKRYASLPSWGYNTLFKIGRRAKKLQDRFIRRLQK
jgi:ectoine hydroxylase-related dioxygenase (phytanoyl-CoA dioxygenase family)